MALLCGVLVTAIGEIYIAPLLMLLNVLPHALLYIRIYLLGMSAILLYNFEAAIFRSVGETKVPLKALAFSGVLNALLNLFLVIVFNMSVNGVAIATVTANVISSVFLLRKLTKTDSVIRVSKENFRCDRAIFIQIIKIGLPAGVQSAVFAAANIIVQSAINSLGTAVTLRL